MQRQDNNNQIDRRTPLQTKQGSLSTNLGKPSYDGKGMTSDSEKFHTREGQPYHQREFESNVQVPERKGREHAVQFGRVRTKILEVCEVGVDHTPFFYVGYERGDSLNGSGRCLFRLRNSQGALLEITEDGIMINNCDGAMVDLCTIFERLTALEQTVADHEARLIAGGL